MDATWAPANAEAYMDIAESVLVAHSDRELQIASAVPTAVRVAAKFTGMSISMSHRCVIPVDATANSNAVATEIALLYWGD